MRSTQKRPLALRFSGHQSVPPSRVKTPATLLTRSLAQATRDDLHLMLLMGPSPWCRMVDFAAPPGIPSHVAPAGGNNVINILNPFSTTCYLKTLIKAIVQYRAFSCDIMFSSKQRQSIFIYASIFFTLLCVMVFSMNFSIRGSSA